MLQFCKKHFRHISCKLLTKISTMCFCIKMGTSIKDVRHFSAIFDLPTHYVQQFLLYNVQYLGAILDPSTYPKIVLHLWTFPLVKNFEPIFYCSLKRKADCNFFIFQSYQPPPPLQKIVAPHWFPPI